MASTTRSEKPSKQNQIALHRARTTWGSAFNMLGSNQQKGAVALEVLAMLAAQDEDVDPAALRQMVEDGFLFVIGGEF